MARDSSGATPGAWQRNALAPGLLAAATLFFAPAILGTEWFLAVRFIVTILALIMAWFAVQAQQWWWLIALVPIAVVWNPIFPLPFDGPVWVAAQPVAALVLLVVGALLKTPRTDPRP